jgi:hypothetical protein
MAYFDCIVGSGSGNGIPLIVTCSSAFAGLQITCSDGTTTLTDTCPSSSPYEIEFSLPNTGTWTVSGTISGTTYTESVLVSEFEVDLKNNVDITVDVYSAANDTVSYAGLDAQTHTITTDSSGHATATITVNPSGSTITFTSSVAKDPSNLSNDYSKAVTLTSASTAIYVMPDNTLYWYGWTSVAPTAVNAYPSGIGSADYGNTAPTLTANTNNLLATLTASNWNAGSVYYQADLTDKTSLKVVIDIGYTQTAAASYPISTGLFTSASVPSGKNFVTADKLQLADRQAKALSLNTLTITDQTASYVGLWLSNRSPYNYFNDYIYALFVE